MDKILDQLNLNVVDFVKFIIIIFLPLTIWFMTLRHDIRMNAVAADSNRGKIEYIRDKQDIFNQKALDKLDHIQQDVAEIKGELKSLKR
jgi:hypothetical protein